MQHVPFENPGSILDWAKTNDLEVTDTQLYKNETLPRLHDFDWLVIMGGPMNIYEEETYPWLAEEKQFIQNAIHSGKVVIGLCLGGQLIADVIGGRVTKNEYREIGWYPVELNDEARSHPLFSFFPPVPVVFEWHGDTFSILPEDAIVVASNTACKNQAFIYKNKVFGFQFHLENTIEIIRDLIEKCGNDMSPDRYVQTPDEVLSHNELIEQDNVWMKMFLTQLKKMYVEGNLDE